MNIMSFSNPLFLRGLGVFLVFLISLFMSEDRKKIDWKNIFFIFVSIWVLAYFLLYSKAGVTVVSHVAKMFEWLYGAGLEGARFIFGDLVDETKVWGFLFAVRVLPMIVFFSALTGVLYYFEAIQWFVKLVGLIFQPIFGTSGPETVCAIANSFLSQTEAPLLIRSYLKNMTDSEIFVVMVSGMSTISCGLFAVYGAFGIPMKHLLISSILSIPGSLFVAKLWVPSRRKDMSRYAVSKIKKGESFFGVLTDWTGSGLMIALHVGAMLIAVISLLYCLNEVLSYIGKFAGYSDFSLEIIFSFLMWPAAKLMGVASEDTCIIASLLGTKVSINEMISYIMLAKTKLGAQSFVYAVYALCGFSNFSCIGIQIGSFSSMEPEVKEAVSRLGVKAVFSGMLVNLLIAYIIGFFV